MTFQSKIIVAFDAMDVSTAASLGSTLYDHVAGGKCNDLLDEGGAKVFDEIYVEAPHTQSQIGIPAPKRMADPKIHDIPNTVYNRVKKYDGKADWVTVHGSNSFKALKKAKNAADDCKSDIKVIVITVTTDVDSEQCKSIFGTGNIKKKVRQLVHRAKMAGLHGIVCSPKEVRMVRKMWPSAIIITPGVRSPGEDVHDQKRVGTPEQAIRDGADYVVCGREVINGGIEAAIRINAGCQRGWEARQQLAA